MMEKTSCSENLQNDFTPAEPSKSYQDHDTPFHSPDAGESIASPSKPQKTIFRTSKLEVMERGFKEKISTFINHSLLSRSKTQLSAKEIEESLWIVLSVPTHLHIGEAVGLRMSLKFLYPQRDERVPEFVALRILSGGVEMDGMVFSEPSGSSEEKGRGKEKEKEKMEQRKTQTLLSFSASSIDDAPTLGLDMDLSLSSIFNSLKMPEKITIPFSTAGNGTGEGATHFLHVKAVVEYFGRVFRAEWRDVPVFVLPKPGEQEEEGDGGEREPPHDGGYAALILPRRGGEAFPAYDDGSQPYEDEIGRAV